MGTRRCIAVAIIIAALAAWAFGDTNDWSWSTDSTREGPRGTGTSSAEGTAQSTQDGARWEVDRTGTSPKGVDWSAETTGSATRNETGYEWSSTTEGSTETGKGWTADKSGEKAINDDGTVTLTKESTKTLDNGATVTAERETTVTKTEDGRSWETTASKTGPAGTSTMNGSGEATRTDTGIGWEAEREGTTAGGRTWESKTAGTATRTDTGRTWQSLTEGQLDGGGSWATTRSGELTRPTQEGLGASPARDVAAAQTWRASVAGSASVAPASATAGVDSGTRTVHPSATSLGRRLQSATGASAPGTTPSANVRRTRSGTSDNTAGTAAARNRETGSRQNSSRGSSRRK